MRFAICNETFLDWPFEEAFACARECGYTGIEFAPFTMNRDVRQISAAERTGVRRLLEANDLQAIGLHWLLAQTEGYYLTSPDRSVQTRTAAYLGDLAELCRDLGGSILVFGSPKQRNLLPGVTHAAATDHAAAVLELALPALEACEVTIALEPLGPSEGDFLLTAAEAVKLIEQVGSPQVRLHLDTKAMSTEALPIPEIIRAQRAVLHHFHANDPNRQGPGFGELDFHPILSALGEIDYRGWVSVEVFDYSPGVERLAHESVRYLEDCLEEEGGADC
ncbi:MAG TPA: sugar phosphate isomerase/epimerase family protein [Pirellulales bacterium]|jgi:sugar phosphate isomerase/epimerase|nr:sugar phosphate isomerase/epimerase family protein [Pirellulales bacterium]